MVLIKHEILLNGGINFRLECTSSSDAKQFLSLLDSFNYTHHIDNATHSCGLALDFVASLDTSSVLCEKPVVIDTLITDSVSGKTLDHSALVWKLSLSLLSSKSHKISYRTLKNLDLESLSNTLSQKLLFLPSSKDTNAHVKFYNNSLKDVLMILHLSLPSKSNVVKLFLSIHLK